ncbi:MAG: hypothetical protein Tsb0015_15590 [Simkaniaceae bacterium]
MSKLLQVPIYWKYLLIEFFKFFILALGSFISAILILKLYDIARFASLRVDIAKIFLFALYQIPYILPLAIPLSSLLSSMLLLHKLSATHEITAMRAGGLGIRDISAPFIFAGLTVFLLNFYITFELSPDCRMRSKSLIENATAFNPILLFQKSKFLKIKDSYIEMTSSERGKDAGDILFFGKNQATGRIFFIMASALEIKKDNLKGKDVSLIAPFSKTNEKDFDNLYIENQSNLTVSANKISKLLRRTSCNINHEYLPTKLLLAKTAMEKKFKPKSVVRARFELARRLSYALLAFSFTYLGMTFGIQIGRSPSKKNLLLTFALASLTFVFFMAGKSFHKNPLLASVCYFFPHLLIFGISTYAQKRLNEGREI